MSAKAPSWDPRALQSPLTTDPAEQGDENTIDDMQPADAVFTANHDAVPASTEQKSSANKSVQAAFQNLGDFRTRVTDGLIQQEKGSKTGPAKDMGAARSANHDVVSPKAESKAGASDPVEPASRAANSSAATSQSTQSNAQVSVMAASSTAPATLAAAMASSPIVTNEKPSTPEPAALSAASSQPGGAAGFVSQQSLDPQATANTTGIITSHVIQAVNASEMRVGMHSMEFGDISIRTAVSQQQMTTQISVEHKDLSDTISAHTASLESKLNSQYGLHTSIEVKQSGSSFSADREQSQQQQQSSTNRPLTVLNGEDEVAFNGAMAQVQPTVGNSSRLDIRA